MAAAPPIMAAGAFGLILGLDAALMVVVVVATTLAAPFTLPAMALWLLDLDIDIGVVELMGRLVLLIGGVFLGAALARRLAGPRWLARNAARLDGVSVLSLIAFAIAIMDGVTGVLMARPEYVLTCLAVAFAANLALQLAAAALFLKVGRLGALSIGLMSGNRNMGMVLAVLADRADFDVVVFFAIGQVPMYTLPVLLLPLYRRLLRP
jgi:BASS family bile acid:Na+ symporter